MKIKVIGGLAIFSLVTAGFATPTGSLTVANCSTPGSDGVRVTATTIDFLPLLTGTGCIVTGASTNLTYAGGSIVGGGVLGTVNDLPAGGPLQFLFFPSNPTLNFTLLGLGPGDGNTTCVATVGVNCSVFAGSPFILTTQAGGNTSVFLRAFGTVSDGTTPNSTWDGAFTVTLSGVTAAAVQTTILGGGSITSTDAGNFSITAIPEPTTLALMGAGLFAFAVIGRRKRSF